MNQENFAGMAVDELIATFESIALEQGDALSENDTEKYNRLYDQLSEIKSELKGRDGDQRRVLATLLDHTNPHVRLKSAIAMLAVAPEAAVKALQRIIDDEEFPEAGYAGSMMDALNEGRYIPA